MKKYLLLLLLTLVPMLSAKSAFIDGIYYNLNSETKTAEVVNEEGGWNAYANSYSGSVDIPASVTYKDVTYTVTSISRTAFSHCTGLTSLTIPNTVTNIPNGAFNGTAWYENLPDGMVYVGLIAYKYKGTAPANTTVTIKEGTLVINDFAFNSCKGITSVTIPNSVTTIGDNAFSGCTGLTTLTIPSSVTSIGASAFTGCTGLTSFTFLASITSIGGYAFTGCTGLTSLTIPSSVTSIGDFAFSGCTGLTSLTIPASVSSIGNLAFNRCKGLTSLIFKATTPPTLGDAIFWEFPTSKCILYVPKQSIDDYWDVKQFREIATIRPIADYVEELSLNETSLTLHLGAATNLVATITPEVVENAELKWTSSNEAVVTVSNTGTLTAVAKGTATITASTTDGSNLSAQCTVTVTDQLDGVVAVEHTTEVEYFTLDGTKVGAPTKPGIYLVKKDRQTKMIVVKK